MKTALQPQLRRAESQFRARSSAALRCAAGVASCLCASTAWAEAEARAGFSERLPAKWRWLDEMTIAGNEVWRVLGLFLSILVALIVGRLLRWTLSGSAARLELRNRHLTAVTLRALAKSEVFLLVVLGLQVGLQFLVLNATVAAIAATIITVLINVAVGYIAYCLVGVVDEWLRQMSQKTASKLDDMLAPLVTKSLRATVAILVLVQVATVLSDKPATSIIAGLGVGGLAVGLAAQDTIKNFFGSLMIFSDRPFEMGDVIIVDAREGSVETVGFRSTRLRTPDGHVISIPNGDLANKPIINVSKRQNLVRRLSLSLNASLPAEKIERALAIVREVLHRHEGMHEDLPPRVFFSELATSAVGLSITYWYHPPDVWKFMAFNERANFEIRRRFEAEGLGFTPSPADGAGDEKAASAERTARPGA